MTKPEDIRRLFERVKQEFGTLDILVSNARPELAAFYTAPMDLTLEQGHRARLAGEGVPARGADGRALMRDGGRIIAISYAPAGSPGSWQPWVAMGAAKAALDSLARYFAVALATRGITVNAISPGLTEDSVLERPADEVPGHRGRGTRAAGRRWAASGLRPTLATPWRCCARKDAGWITGWPGSSHV